MLFEVLVLDFANDDRTRVCLMNGNGVEQVLGVKRHSIGKLVDDDPEVDLCFWPGETHIQRE